MNRTPTNRGLLVLERTNWFARKGGQGPSREIAVGGTHEEILKRYRGVEGNAWPDDPSGSGVPLTSGFAPVDQLPAVVRYVQAVRQQSHEIVDLILCEHSTSVRAMPGFSFCGFDYGYYVCETNSYSFVFNEIIYCRFPECRPLASTLNTSLLLGSLEALRIVEDGRLQLLKDGKNIENDEQCVPLAIYTPDVPK